MGVAGASALLSLPVSAQVDPNPSIDNNSSRVAQTPDTDNDTDNTETETARVLTPWSFAKDIFSGL